MELNETIDFKQIANVLPLIKGKISIFDYISNF